MSSLLMAQKEYSFFLDHFAVKNEAIQNLGYMILGSVKAENSYLLHLRSEDKEDFYEKISSAKDNVRELEDLEQLIQEKVGADETVQNMLNQIDSMITSYEAETLSLFDMLVEKGLSEDEGLRGEFRTAAHELEAVITEHHRSSLMIEYLMMRRHEKDYLLRLTEKYAGRNSESIKTIRGMIREESFSEEVETLMLQTLDTYARGIARIIAVNKSIRQKEEAIQKEYNDLLPLLMREQENSNQLLIERRGELEQAVGRFIRLGLAAVSFVLLLSIFMAFRLFRQISRPLGIVMDGVEKVARGDMTWEPAYVRKDELGEISTGLYRAVESTRALLLSIQDSFSDSISLSRNITGASAETSAAITEILANLESITRQVEHLSREVDGNYHSCVNISDAVKTLDSLVEDQSSAVVQSSASVEQMMSSINSVSHITSQRFEGSEKLVGYTRDGSHQIEKANQQILNVAKQTDSILEITAVIDNIASQTNLLAMNAAIEAAHAGEAGKGFAVVADEIRKLAESSGQNSRAITELLDAISLAIRNASDSSGESLNSFKLIQSEVGILVSSLSEIATSMTQMSSGATQVLSASGALTQSVAGVSEQTSVIVNSTEDITKGVEKSREMVELTKQGVEEIAQGVRLIQQSVVVLDEESHKNEEGLETLKDQIEHFRLT